MTDDRQEVAPGEDRALGEPIQWAAFSHRQLYDALHADNEPGKAHERAREWDELAREVESASEEFARVLRESEVGWRGDAADVGRAVMHDLSRRGEDVSRTTQGVGRFLAEQANVMERAKAEMPEPPEVPAEEMHQRLITGGGPSEMIALVTAAAAAEKQRQDAAHQHAVDVMAAMETGSRRVDESTPGFKVARERTSEVRKRLDNRARSGSRPAGPGAGGQHHGTGSQSSALSGPGEPTAPDGRGAPDLANHPGGDSTASPPAARAGGGDLAAQVAAPGIGDPNAETKQFTALSGGTSPGLPDSGGPESQQNAGGPAGPSTDSAPELSEFTSDPAQTTSSSAGPANAGALSGGSHSGGPQVPTAQGSGDQQHWSKFSGAHGPNSQNRKWSGSLSDKSTPSKTIPEGLADGISGKPVPPAGSTGSGSVPPPASGDGAGGGVSLSPGGSAGTAPGAGGSGGGATSSGGGSSSGGASTGGMPMGGVPVGGGAAGARQGGGEDKEYRSPEYLKDQSLFEVEERPAPPVLGEKFKKKK